MSITANRRDILKFLGGTVVGTFLTPMPWKLLDDTAIWTQTGPWISKLPRGLESTRFSTCTVCPASCGTKVRSVKGTPFAVHPVNFHPLSAGSVCATGAASHHLLYHPLRMQTPLRLSQRGSHREAEPASAQEVIAVIRSAISDSGSVRVAILDQRPGRTSSLFYRKVLRGISNGLYIVAPSDESMMFEGFRALTGEPLGPLGLDLERAKLVVSFGVPLLENHGSLGLVKRSLDNRLQKVIQIEAGASRTAILADEWISIRPGTEGVLALGIAHLLLRYRSVQDSAYTRVAGQFSPSVVSKKTGISEQQLAALAEEIASTKPAVILGGPNPSSGSRPLSEDMAIWGLNLLAGQFGTTGGIIERSEVPVPPAYNDSQLTSVTNLRDVSDGSISVLLIDASQPGSPLPWGSLKRKLDPKHSLVVVMTATLSGAARFSDYAIPTAAPFEFLTDAVTPEGSLTPSFGVSAPMVQPLAAATDPVQFIGESFGTPKTTEQLLRERITAIHASGRGKVFIPASGSTTTVKDLIAADDLATLLLEGGLWQGEGIPQQKSRRFSLCGTSKKHSLDSIAASMEFSTEEGLSLILQGRRNGTSHSQLPPIMTKLVQESGLWGSDEAIQVHPETAASAGLEEGDDAILTIGSEERAVKVRVHGGLRPGIVQMSVGPNPVTIGSDYAEFGVEVLDLLEPDDHLGWGRCRVTLRKA